MMLKQEIAGIEIRDTYPNYAIFGSKVKTVRNFLYFGNFVAFVSEMYRNSTTNIAEQGIQDNGTARQLIGSNITPYVIDAETGQLVKNDNEMYATGY